MKKYNHNNILLNLLLQGTGETAVLIDSEGVIADLSQSFASRFSAQRDDLLGRNIWTLFDKHNARSRRRHVRQVFHTGKSKRHLDERDGLWNDYSIHPVFDASGKVKQAAIFVRDVTRLKNVMDELRLARQALENTRNPIAIADGDAVVTYVNQACLDLWGYTSHDELIGKGIHEFWREPLDTDHVEYFLTTQGSWRGIRTAIAKNGATFSVLVSASAIMDEHDRPVGFVGSFMDMETMDRVREVRKKTETDYEALLETLRQGVWKVDAQMNTTYVNSQMSAMLKTEKHDMLGEKPHKFLTEKSLQDFSAIMRRSKRGKREQFDFELLCSDGAVIETLVNSVPLFDEHGLYSGSLAGFTDITARKEKENRIRESEEKYRTLVSNMQEVLWVCDSEFKTTFVNDVVQDYLGFSSDELLGKRMYDILFEEDFPDYDRRNTERSQGLSETYEQRFKTKKGGDAWGLISSTPIFNDKGEFMGATALVTDITRRKHAEDAFKVIYDRAAVGILFHDDKGRILAANPCMCDLLDCPERELLRMSVDRIVQDDDRNKLLEDFSLLLEDMEVYSERKLIRPDGGTIFTEVHGKRLRENLIVEMHRDVSRRRLEERQKVELERVIRHDLKGILNNVINLPQIIKADANLTKKQKDIVHVIEESGKNMLNIIDNHFRIFQIERKNYELKRRTLDIGQFVQGVLYNYSSISAAKKLHIQFDKQDVCGQRKGVLVNADSSLCHVMLNNLILNAIEAAPDPGGTIRITIAPVNGMVEIVIKNDGPIPKDLQPRFGQKYATHKEMGTGIGVYSAKLIANAQGGTFDWESDDRTTTIKLRLPAAR